MPLGPLHPFCLPPYLLLSGNTHLFSVSMSSFWFSFFLKKIYCYSITVVCPFSPSLHPTPAKPTSLPHLHPPPWFCPCVLYSSSCNPVCFVFKALNKRVIRQCLSLTVRLIALSITPSRSIHAVQMTRFHSLYGKPVLLCRCMRQPGL